jgi:glycosyltransferase involved in cell wall biosynthesis
MASTIIVVPCFNEANRLAPQTFHDFARRWPHGRFLFVDDGSTDGTYKVIAGLRAIRRRITQSYSTTRMPSASNVTGKRFVNSKPSAL